MKVFAWCLALGSLFVLAFIPAGEWLMLPTFLVVPWMVERHAVRRQMDRELALIVRAPD